MFDSRHIGLFFLRSFLFPFLKISTIIAFFHAVGIRLSDKHLVYSLASVFKMVSSPAFNILMFMWLLPVAVPFFISHSAVSTSHDAISGTLFGSVWIIVLTLFTVIYRARHWHWPDGPRYVLRHWASSGHRFLNYTGRVGWASGFNPNDHHRCSCNVTFHRKNSTTLIH